MKDRFLGVSDLLSIDCEQSKTYLEVQDLGVNDNSLDISEVLVVLESLEIKPSRQ